MKWQTELLSDASLEPIFFTQSAGRISTTSELPEDMPEYSPNFLQAQTHFCESTQSVLFHILDLDDESSDDPHHYVDVPVNCDLASHSDTDLDQDSTGPYVELCFTSDMSPIVLSEAQHTSMTPGDIATMRVYISANIKRAVVVKEDDLLTKKELAHHEAAVAAATIDELKIWIDNDCFKVCDMSKAQNIMTSRYVAKRKYVKSPDGKQKRIIRMRLCLRGFMDLEAFSLDTFAGTARRQSQRILASEAACHKDWIIASMDIDKAFLKGLTYKELAEATGEKERTVCFTLPPGSAQLLRKLKGFEHFDD